MGEMLKPFTVNKNNKIGKIEEKAKFNDINKLTSIHNN